MISAHIDRLQKDSDKLAEYIAQLDQIGDNETKKIALMKQEFLQLRLAEINN